MLKRDECNFYQLARNFLPTCAQLVARNFWHLRVTYEKLRASLDMIKKEFKDFLRATYSTYDPNGHLYKSDNAPNQYPTMHHFVTEIDVGKWCIVGYLSYALWNLWDGWLIHNFTFLVIFKDENITKDCRPYLI